MGKKWKRIFFFPTRVTRVCVGECVCVSVYVCV